MHRIDADAHVSNLFSDGDAGIGQPGTKVDAAWLNAVQEELCHLVEVAGLSLIKADHTQVEDAIRAIITSTFTPTWINIGSGGSTFGSNWGAGANVPQFYKDPAGWVHFQGSVLAGAVPNVSAFTMPAGYQPVGNLSREMLLLDRAASAPVRMTIFGSGTGGPGQCRPAAPVVSMDVSLDGLTYYAG